MANLSGHSICNLIITIFQEKKPNFKGARPLPRGQPEQPQHLGVQDAHHGVHLLPQRLWQHLPHGCFPGRGVPHVWHPGLNSYIGRLNLL